MKKTDNHNLKAKLELRRKMLIGQAGLSVVDCFSGKSEAIWTILRKEVDVAEYLALDIKRKKGRLAIDSLKFLRGQKWMHNIVDLDAYGSPWEHWGEVLKSDRHEVITVFLTIGTSMLGNLSAWSLRALGVPENTPIGMHRQLAEKCVSNCLAHLYKHDWIPMSAHEALNPGGNARYIGIKIRKKHEHRNNHRLDRPHIQCVDGMRQSQRGMPQLLCGNSDKKPHGS
jgi:hypothetical protein